MSRPLFSLKCTLNLSGNNREEAHTFSPTLVNLLIGHMRFRRGRTSWCCLFQSFLNHRQVSHIKERMFIVLPKVAQCLCTEAKLRPLAFVYERGVNRLMPFALAWRAHIGDGPSSGEPGQLRSERVQSARPNKSD